MRSDLSPAVLFLDFDGVICDSLEECFRSSWLTGAGIPVSAALPPDPPFDAAYRARFDACRPFIRSGEDYLVVHEWAARGQVPANQAAFDATLAQKGPQELAHLKQRLYAVRDALLEKHHTRWLGWNPLYPGMAGALAAQASNPDVWILSTKKAEFIVEILNHHGVNWPLGRTIYTGTRRKLDIIAERVGSRPSALIDDQVDHLDFAHPSCRCALALWGYVAPGAAENAPDSLTLDKAVELIASFPTRRPSA
jgi:phosphoglycolate phosphatase-like HAD superfamily hydrolase